MLMRICNQQEQITKYLSYDDTNILYETEKLKKENQYATVCESILPTATASTELSTVL